MHVPGSYLSVEKHVLSWELQRSQNTQRIVLAEIDSAATARQLAERQLVEVQRMQEQRTNDEVAFERERLELTQQRVVLLTKQVERLTSMVIPMEAELCQLQHDKGALENKARVLQTALDNVPAERAVELATVTAKIEAELRESEADREQQIHKFMHSSIHKYLIGESDTDEQVLSLTRELIGAKMAEKQMLSRFLAAQSLSDARRLQVSGRHCAFTHAKWPRTRAWVFLHAGTQHTHTHTHRLARFAVQQRRLSCGSLSCSRSSSTALATGGWRATRCSAMPTAARSKS